MDSKRRSSEQVNNDRPDRSNVGNLLTSNTKRKSPSLDTLSMRRQRQAQQQQVLNAQRKFLEQMMISGSSGSDLSDPVHSNLARSSSSTDCNNNCGQSTGQTIKQPRAKPRQPIASVSNLVDTKNVVLDKSCDNKPIQPPIGRSKIKDSGRPRTTQDSRALLMAIMSRHRLGHIRLPVFDSQIPGSSETTTAIADPDDNEEEDNDQIKITTGRYRAYRGEARIRRQSIDDDSITDDSELYSQSRRSSMFSQLGSIDGDSADECQDPDTMVCSSVPTEVINEREKRRSGGYPGLAFGSSMFASNTMMRFRIISNELHNIQNVQLKRVRYDQAKYYGCAG